MDIEMNASVPAPEQALVECLGPLRTWASRRIPAYARGRYDTVDLVQEVAARAWPRLQYFEHQHPRALEAYLRRAIMNLIRDEVRREARRPSPGELPGDVPSPVPSAAERLVRRENLQQCRRALLTLSPRDRRLVLARVMAERQPAALAEEFGFASSDAARMAAARALARVVRAMEGD